MLVVSRLAWPSQARIVLRLTPARSRWQAFVCRLFLARDSRHSQATALLRGGASLEVIASLLRHASLNTTMIYAKTDTVMLQEVAQPWVGGGAQ